MIEITIDADLCRRDGLCATACARGILEQDEKGAVPKILETEVEHCFRCGHCVAICPAGAVSHSHFPEGTVTPVSAEDLPGYDQVLELMRGRRSKREFRDKPVDGDVIEKVLEAARFAPSGHNEQTTEFVVVRDKKILNEIASLTAEGMGKMAGYTRSPIGRIMMRRAMGRRSADYVTELAPELEGLVAMFREGRDLILNNAPALVLFCADSVGGTFASINANLALHNAALAAETLGLGCFYGGFVVIASEREGRIARLVGLPETHKIYGALALGRPRLTYKKWPEREPARVTWLGGE